MILMVVGGGGREHALIKKISENPAVSKIYALPGNAGMSEAECVPIKATDLSAIRGFAIAHGVDFAVVAPDDPLVLGLVDELESVGIPCFGPNKDAAIIEGSKAWAKDLMAKYNIPTAEYRIFDRAAIAMEYVQDQRYPLVIKADGLALGKGVTIVSDKGEAVQIIDEVMNKGKFGDSGGRIVIEQYLSGPEVSVLTFTDGETIVPMISSMDHKQIFANDRGPNTGGMGAVAPNPYYTDEIARECMETIFLPTIRAMKAEGRPFRGCLYFGLMLTKDGPKVIEYNCRFGDPETQAVLPLLETDLLGIMQSCASRRLHEIEIRFRRETCCCVVLASGGYPLEYKTGLPINIGETVNDAIIYFAGVKKDEQGNLLTSGGRVLGVTATAEYLRVAINKAYQAAAGISFDNVYYRKDIGKRALEALK